MPCVVDTSYQDEEWAKANQAHHEEVETILEEILTGDPDECVPKIKYRARYQEAREKLAKEFVRIHEGLYNEEGLKAGVALIMKRKKRGRKE